MAHSPSQKWEGNTLAERGLDSRGAKEENTAQAVTGRPNDTPIRDDEDAPLGGNSTFGSRSKERSPRSKAVQEAENKAVKGTTTKASK